MYHEEKIIDGVLCFRSTPKGLFQPYTAKLLTEKIVKLKEKINQQADEIENLAERLEDIYNI